MNETLLKIYLDDHYAGSTAGRELARRTLANNRNEGELTAFLERLVREIDEDRAALKGLMERVGVPANPVKSGVGWAAEKVGRLKLNGRLTGYSPLSRVVELEALVMGVTGKLSLWRSLQQVATLDRRIETTDLDRLARRAEEQIAELERHRQAAARAALS